MYHSKRGVCMTYGELRLLVRDIALSKRLHPARSVARRRDRLTRKKSQILDVKRLEMSTKDYIRSYHSILPLAMEGLSPEQIWNCDETGFCPQGRNLLV
ncbi:hypothetical protein PHMEG_00040520 [Phytophthora megakarya]|uniref:Uncharacterized protein n=1 Tax=Phytophthora megakarya TaxID=4795 RepID=A0A225UG10_9STRA|nr:hypothetical protein PHMEG_00040520 [Phytophthora megakarya]